VAKLFVPRKANSQKVLYAVLVKVLVRSNRLIPAFRHSLNNALELFYENGSYSESIPPFIDLFLLRFLVKVTDPPAGCKEFPLLEVIFECFERREGAVSEQKYCLGKVDRRCRTLPKSP